MSDIDKNPIIRRNQKRFKQSVDLGKISLSEALKKKIKNWYRTATVESNSEEREEHRHTPTEQKLISKFIKRMSLSPAQPKFKKNKKQVSKDPKDSEQAQKKEKRKTILAENIDIAKGLSDLTIPRCPDFGYPSDIQFEDIGIVKN